MPVKLLLILHSWFITPSYEYVLVSSLLRHFLLIAHPPLHQEVLSYRTLVNKLFLLQDSLLCQAGSKLLQGVFQELVLLLHGLLVIQLPLSGLKEVLLQPLLIQEEVVV